MDNAFLTDNGYLISGSSGSKFLKIWKIRTPLEYGYSEDDESPEYDLESTEVRELQILRDHSDYLTCVKIFGNTIYSSCSDGEVSFRISHIYLWGLLKTKFSTDINKQTSKTASIPLGQKRE